MISPQANRRDYVFDSPEDGSIKDSERMRRTDAEKPPIWLEEVKMHTPISKDMEYLWPLNNNKTKLKQYVSENGKFKKQTAITDINTKHTILTTLNRCTTSSYFKKLLY